MCDQPRALTGELLSRASQQKLEGSNMLEILWMVEQEFEWCLWMAAFLASGRNLGYFFHKKSNVDMYFDEFSKSVFKLICLAVLPLGRAQLIANYLITNIIFTPVLNKS